MIIYPTMELLNGHCVSLDRGRLDEPSVWHVNIVETARGFAAAGAEWMHLTDFDAVEGRDVNAGLIEEIIRTVGIPVQLGGGMRGRERIERWIDRGAGRIVVGSLAAQEAGVSIDCAEAGPRVTRYTLSDDGTRVEDSQELTPGDFDALWKRIDGTGWRNLRDCDAPAGDNEPVYTYEVADWNGRTTFQCDGLHQPFPYSAIVDELDARAAKIRGDRGRNTLDIDDSDLDDDRR